MQIAEHGMKFTTIKKVLRSEIKKWLDSISALGHQELRETIEKDVIVAGGSIASMLMGQSASDYDVYFRTKATTLAVANHYVMRFNAEQGTLPTAVKNYNPKVIEASVANLRGETEERIQIRIQSAGAAAEDMETQYTYFENSSDRSTDDFTEDLLSKITPADVEEIKDTVKKDKAKYRPVFMTDNAISLSGRIQIVIRFYGEPDKILDNYDFAHCMSYYDYAKDELVVPYDALQAIVTKTLIYKGSLYPLCSMFRLRKFIERGFRISVGECLKIAWQINSIDMENREMLYEQLIGVDQAYTTQLITALKSADRVDYAYVVKLLDGIFQ